MTAKTTPSPNAGAGPATDSGSLQRPLVLVFVRAENDLDHIVPVMEALLARGKVDLRAVVYDPLKSFKGDPRLLYLSARYSLDCRHAFESPGAGFLGRLFLPAMQCLLWVTLGALRRSGSGWKKKTLTRLSRALRHHLERRLERLAGDRILTPYIKSRSRAAVVFDHTMSDFAVAVVKSAQARGFQALALPHAVVHRRDAPDNPGDENAPAAAEGSLRRPPGSHGYNLYDAVIAPNEYVRDRMVRRGVLEEKLAVLGSARFSTEWVGRLREILPTFRTGRQGKAVLFILSKQTSLVDWPAVERVITHLAATPGLDVVIKVHPRSEMSGLPDLASGSAIRLAPTEWNTASLIDWSDLVIFWGSSAIYDALRVGKPIIQLGFVTSSRFDFEDLIPSWQAETFEAFQQSLSAALAEGCVNYDAAEAASTIDSLLDSGRSGIPEIHARFIESRAEHIRTDTSGQEITSTPTAPSRAAAKL